MRILVFIASMCWAAGLSASDLITWSRGVIVLSDGEVRQGELAFQVPEMVLFRSSAEVSVLPADKVRSFRYYDSHQDINRKFVSLKASSPQAAFYEVVVWGEVSVLRKLNRSMISNRKISDRDDYDYFVYVHDSMVPLKRFRNKIYPQLISTHRQVEAQIKSDRLNPNYQSDAIQIIQLYNKAISVETVVAGI